MTDKNSVQIEGKFYVTLTQHLQQNILKIFWARKPWAKEIKSLKFWKIYNRDQMRSVLSTYIYTHIQTHMANLQDL